jgi:lactate permease
MVWSRSTSAASPSTLVAIPIVVMLGCLAFLHIKALWAAIPDHRRADHATSPGQPAKMAGMAAFNGALFGLLPIGWIVLNIIFLYRLTEESGSFKILRDSIAHITPDRRLQLLLIAFSFGAFFEGAAGFGTPVAVTAAVLIGLGFSPLAASACR